MSTNNTNLTKDSNTKEVKISNEPTLRDKLSKIYEEFEKKGLKTKDANFVGSARINYFRGSI